MIDRQRAKRGAANVGGESLPVVPAAPGSPSLIAASCETSPASGSPDVGGGD